MDDGGWGCFLSLGKEQGHLPGFLWCGERHRLCLGNLSVNQMIN